jgi:NADH-quinone oxidoreductase subunit L
MSKLVYLVPLFPLLGFLVNGLFRKSLSKQLIGIIGSGAMLASFVVSLLIFFDVKNGGGATVQLFILTYYYGYWIFNSFVLDSIYARRRAHAFW